MKSRHFQWWLPCLALCLAAAFCARVNAQTAQTWPTKPIRFIVPFAPGGYYHVVHLCCRYRSAYLGAGNERQTTAGGLGSHSIVSVIASLGLHGAGGFR